MRNSSAGFTFYFKGLVFGAAALTIIALASCSGMKARGPAGDGETPAASDDRFVPTEPTKPDFHIDDKTAKCVWHLNYRGGVEKWQRCTDQACYPAKTIEKLAESKHQEDRDFAAWVKTDAARKTVQTAIDLAVKEAAEKKSPVTENEPQAAPASEKFDDLFEPDATDAQYQECFKNALDLLGRTHGGYLLVPNYQGGSAKDFVKDFARDKIKPAGETLLGHAYMTSQGRAFGLPIGTHEPSVFDACLRALQTEAGIKELKAGASAEKFQAYIEQARKKKPVAVVCGRPYSSEMYKYRFRVDCTTCPNCTAIALYTVTSEIMKGYEVIEANDELNGAICGKVFTAQGVTRAPACGVYSADSASPTSFDIYNKIPAERKKQLGW